MESLSQTGGGQTFTAGVTGQLTRADINLFCSTCTGTFPNLTLSLRNTSANLPAGADVASATLTGSNSGAGVYYTAVFASPPTLVAGTVYALVVHPTANPSAGTYAITRSSTNVYAGGQRVNSANSGSTWTAPLTAGQTTDAGFATYINTGFALSGNQISGLKDANPAAGQAPRWTTLSWNAASPANTTVQFQAAASNSVYGPFNLVGPDGTASTFFTTSGASLCQFNGFRYLKYDALLSTTDRTVTPTLSDVTVCFDNNAQAIPTITPDGPTTFCTGGSVTLTSSSASGNQWYLNGTAIGGATNQAYIATASGDYTVTDTASGCASSPSAPTAVTVNPTPAKPFSTPGGATTFCAGGSVTLSSNSATGIQWYLDGNPIGGANSQNYIAAASGSYTATLNALGCVSAASDPISVTVNPIPAAPTITPGGPTTFCEGGSVTLTSNSDSDSGSQWYLNGNPIGGATNQAYIATAAGDYSVTVMAIGCTSAASSATSVTVNPIATTPTITPGGATTFCAGGNVTLTSSSASGNQWYLNGNPIGGATNQGYNATVAGDYSVTDTASGCTSAPSTATTVTVNPIPATQTITAGGPTTFCAGNSVTLASSSANGNQWYLDGNPIGGATSQGYIATASGNYTITDTANACTSAASAATTVTVNPTPATPTITPGGPTTFCNGNSVTLTSSSASGNQWYLDGNPIGGATNQAFFANAAGSYTVTDTALGCTSTPSTPTSVTVNPIPATPTITPGGPTTFCAGGSVTLTSSIASDNQWYLNGNPIGGATNQNYIATAAGDYTDIVTVAGCPSASSAATTVTVNPIPATPTITPGGPTTFCDGASVTLTSSGASGNQWYLDGNPIGGATNQAYIATASGGYTVTGTASGCASAPSASTAVTVNPIPATPTITPDGPTTFCAGGSVTLASSSASGNQWYLNNNPIGSATSQAYIATASGDYTDIVTANGCAGSPSAPTTVTATPSPSTATVGAPQTICPSNSTAPLEGNTPTSGTGTWTVQSGGTGTFSSASAPNATFTHTSGVGPIVLRWTISNSPCADAIAEVTITVSSAPALTYPSPQSVVFNGSLNVTPTAASASITGYAVQSVVPAFTTAPTVNASGVVSITNAQPSASHIITIRATDNCGATTDASFTLNMGKSNQTITFAALKNKTFGDVDFAVSGTSDSGLALSFAGFGQCTVSGSMVHIMGAGSCTITASQAGNSDYDAATDLPQSFIIANSALMTLSQSNYDVNESTGFVTITVNRTGDLSAPASVDYATDDTGSSDVCSTLNSGLASSRCDFGLTLGTLNFAATETEKTFIIPITQESFNEGPEMFTVNLSNLTGTGIALASPASATVTINDSASPAPNASDDTKAFVRQQYRDFLNREADPAGLAFWTNQIDSCGSDADCRDIKRVNVSAAFFLSIEFQTTGNLVRSFYVAALNRPATNNMPAFAEFEEDTQAMQRGLIVDPNNNAWQTVLNNNRDAFMRDFVTRTEFVGLYPTTDTPAQYVDKLYLHAGITPALSERAGAIAEFGSATTAADAGACGRALLDVTQNTTFHEREMNRSFVQMEYFGYLRRNPNDAPDGNFDGYNFWVNKLNAAGENFITSDMVKAFIVSSEYRRRFGP